MPGKAARRRSATWSRSAAVATMPCIMTTGNGPANALDKIAINNNTDMYDAMGEQGNGEELRAGVITRGFPKGFGHVG